MENTKTLDLEPIITGLCYRKNETLTETEIKQAIADAILNFGVEYVTALPAGSNIKEKVYIVPDTTQSTGNFGDIYVYDKTNTKWIHVDGLKFNIDDYSKISDIKDNLTSEDTNKPLSANQGKVLKGLIDGKSASNHGHGSVSNTGTLNSDISSVNKVAVTDSSNNLKTINKLPLDKVTHQDISGKVDVAQGTSNCSKNVVTDQSGNITTEDKPIIPSKTSDLTNDSGFLTSHQSLSNYVQKSQTNGLLKNDGSVDTNTYLTSHQDISGKVNVSDIKDNLTSEDTNKPLSAYQGKVLKNRISDLVEGKAPISHTHSMSQIIDIPTVTLSVTYEDSTTGTFTLYGQEVV